MEMNLLVGEVIEQVFEERRKDLENFNFIEYKPPFRKSITDKENVYCAMIIGLAENQAREKEIVQDLLSPKRKYQLVEGDIIELNFYGQKALYIVRKKDVLTMEFWATFRGSKEDYYEFLKSIPEMRKKCITV